MQHHFQPLSDCKEKIEFACPTGASQVSARLGKDDVLEMEASEAQLARRGLLVSCISAAVLASSSVPKPGIASPKQEECEFK